ncbi:3-hydroxyacyl-CoA dehydrogenase family protein [Rubripirellula reticaptiva]|uniref:Fatty acid oxidation complex subunit alpha n=1 Tax=Rubripirellula reticaptiva TaxID=2528013 RepID=A0A5C6F809_9BACT|nr:3-hydroxyacyl-CoA dehydrogenase family protein [Rubripirellula reticaptiva]TWU56236.1 Fatty acid oxidation complex subunit alpha [Rubripirellula reticaptiva]
MSLAGTILVGAGVVGRSILRAHIDARISVHLVDMNPSAIELAIDSLDLSDDWQVMPPAQISESLTTVPIRHGRDSEPRPTILIESIAERLDVKQKFFAEAAQVFADETVFCSNTSTLRITTIASSLQCASRFAGMHFFMPVEQRPAVEIVRGERTSEATIQACNQHVLRLGKEPLVVKDSPGFIVNRLLSPYLNQAMLLLCHGVAADRIERAAIAYGMPMSPLELIDTIGTRTTFDAGRVYWQSFPNRIAPAPMLGKMIKTGRLGKSVGAGFYDYTNGQRSQDLAPETIKLAESYFRPIAELTDLDLVELLSIPMRIEAAIAHDEGTVSLFESFDVAMRGGLGFSPHQAWSEFFNDLGSDTIQSSIERWRPTFKSMNHDLSARQLLEQRPS